MVQLFLQGRIVLVCYSGDQGLTERKRETQIIFTVQALTWCRVFRVSRLLTLLHSEDTRQTTPGEVTFFFFLTFH